MRTHTELICKDISRFTGSAISPRVFTGTADSPWVFTWYRRQPMSVVAVAVCDMSVLAVTVRPMSVLAVSVFPMSVLALAVSPVSVLWNCSQPMSIVEHVFLVSVLSRCDKAVNVGFGVTDTIWVGDILLNVAVCSKDSEHLVLTAGPSFDQPLTLVRWGEMQRAVAGMHVPLMAHRVADHCHMLKKNPCPSLTFWGHP